MHGGKQNFAKIYILIDVLFHPHVFTNAISKQWNAIIKTIVKIDYI